MALGRAFIEVHADLKPFKKSMGTEVGRVIKETQKAVDKAVSESVDKAVGGKGGGKGRVIRPKIKPDLDTRDADRRSRGFFGRLVDYSKKTWKSVSDGFAYAIENGGEVRTAAIAIGVIVATIASPLVAAAIAGAITAGIGLAGIGAGIALAFQDERIKASAQQMWDGVMKRLTNASAVFLKPLERGLDLLFAGVDRFVSRLENSFSALAPYVDDLGSGLAGFLDALGPGLEAAFSNSGPFIQIVAEYLPVIGDAIGYMFQKFSESEGARAGLVAFFQMLADAIIYTTDIITFLSDAFAKFVRFIYPLLLAGEALGKINVPDGFLADLGEMIDGMDLAKQSSEGAARGILTFGNNAAGAKTQTDLLTQSLNVFFQAALNNTDAAINFESSLDGVVSSLKENGKNLDINTAKGRANVSAVNNTIKAAIAARDAKIKETGSVADGNAVYSTYIDRLIGVLRKAGLTEGQINDLIGAYKDLPPSVSTEVSAPGLAGTLSQAQRLNAELAQINRERRAAIQSKKNPNGNGVGGLAEGGVVRREQLTWIGEGNKPEAVIPLTNPKRAAEVMNEAGLGGMGGTVVVQLVMDGKVIEEKVVQVNQAQARKIQQQPRRVI